MGKPTGRVTTSTHLIGARIEQPSFLGRNPIDFVIDKGEFIEKYFERTGSMKVSPVDNSITKLSEIAGNQRAIRILFDRWHKIASKLIPNNSTAHLTGEQHNAKRIITLLTEIRNVIDDTSKSDESFRCGLVLQALDLGGAITRAGLWPQARQLQQRKASLAGIQSIKANSEAIKQRIVKIAAIVPHFQRSLKVNYVLNHWPKLAGKCPSRNTVERALLLRK
jgi:hypothetical protein